MGIRRFEQKLFTGGRTLSGETTNLLDLASEISCHLTQVFDPGSPRTYMNRRRDWLLKTIKDNKTIEIIEL